MHQTPGVLPKHHRTQRRVSPNPPYLPLPHELTNKSYCIASSWKITYPKDLRRNLAKTPGITMIDYQNIDFDTCGWNTGIESVEAKSVDRGTI